MLQAGSLSHPHMGMWVPACPFSLDQYLLPGTVSAPRSTPITGNSFCLLGDHREVWSLGGLGVLPHVFFFSAGSRRGGCRSSMASDPSPGAAGTSDSLPESTPLKSELPFQNGRRWEAGVDRKEGVLPGEGPVDPAARRRVRQRICVPLSGRALPPLRPDTSIPAPGVEFPSAQGMAEAVRTRRPRDGAGP